MCSFAKLGYILIKVHACVCTYVRSFAFMNEAFSHEKSHLLHQGSIPICSEVAANVFTFYRHVLHGTQSAGL